jgi:hypothetical protein
MDNLEVQNIDLLQYPEGVQFEVSWNPTGKQFALGKQLGFAIFDISDIEDVQIITDFAPKNEKIIPPSIKKIIWFDDETLFLMTNFAQVIRWDVNNNCASGFIPDLAFEDETK